MTYRLIILLLIAFVLSPCTAGATEDVCTKENYSATNRLYESQSVELIKNLFSILDCDGKLSKEKNRGQWVALVGGVMMQHPEWIETLIESANHSSNVTAAKICIDGLWFCGTKECRTKLKGRPFKLPQSDIDRLLREDPPNPKTMRIESPASLDMMWYYFIATGDKIIPERIFEFLRSNWARFENTKTKGTDFLLLFGSARWSFLSMAEQHSLVRKVLDSKASTSKEAQALLAELDKK